MSFLRLSLTRNVVRRGSTWASNSLHSLKLHDAPLDIHPEVEDALAHHRPVVALETALVTHGLPYPSSLQVPLALEGIVRSTGSVPATIGIIGGRVKIGLERDELERLADAREKPAKISRRDIAAAITAEKDGGTTCSATLVFAALAGIKVFATGGLGGVHRGGENSMDISADLQELTRCPVGLVSSGVKSILDIGRTLEYLETLGVPVIQYGDSQEFSAFFSRHSGYYVPWNVEDPVTAARILYTQWQLGMTGGALVSVPIPEEYEAVGLEIQGFVHQALLESEETGMSTRGKEVTPWLLNRVFELSRGKSLESNFALLKNTALVGGQIAVQYERLKNESGHFLTRKEAVELENRTLKVPETFPGLKQVTLHPASADVVVIGSTALDITAREDRNVDPSLAPHSTIPGSVTLTLGGVARNIAEASHRIMQAERSTSSSLLLAPVGDDLLGHVLVEEFDKLGMRSDGLIKVQNRTAVCNIVLDSAGQLIGGVSDMDITRAFSGKMIIPQLQKYVPGLVAFDGNLSSETMEAVVKYCSQHGIKVLYEPTSVVKSSRIVRTLASFLNEENSGPAPITFFTPNLLELIEVYEQARSESFDLMSHPSWWGTIDSLSLGSSFRMDLEQLAKRQASNDGHSKENLSFLVDQGIAQMAVNLLPFFQHIIIKCGSEGVLVAMCISEKDSQPSAWVCQRTNIAQRCIVAHGKSKEIVVLKHFPALPVESILNVTGAGDSFVGAFCASIANKAYALYDPLSLDTTINTAQRAAALTLQSHAAVSPLLSEINKVRT